MPVAPGTLALEDAWLRYGPDAPWALAGVSLRLEPGRRVARRGGRFAAMRALAV